MLSRHIIIIAISTILVAEVAPADIFEKSLGYVSWGRNKRILTEDDRSNIVAAFEGTGNIAMQAAFDLVLNKRLQLVDPEVRQQVMSNLQSRVTINYDGGLEGSYSPAEGSSTAEIQLYLPRSLKGSSVHYGMLIHEVEHLIQDILLKKEGIDFHSELFLDNENFKNEIEKRAMTLEWNFFNALPETVMSAELKKLERARRINRFPMLQDAYRQVMAAVEQASENLSTWLEGQHRLGRYAPTRMIRHFGGGKGKCARLIREFRQ
jgi:hypothetical protein